MYTLHLSPTSISTSTSTSMSTSTSASASTETSMSTLTSMSISMSATAPATSQRGLSTPHVSASRRVYVPPAPDHIAVALSADADAADPARVDDAESGMCARVCSIRGRGGGVGDDANREEEGWTEMALRSEVDLRRTRTRTMTRTASESDRKCGFKSVLCLPVSVPVHLPRRRRGVNEDEMSALDAEADTNATASKLVTCSQNGNGNVKENVNGSWSSDARSILIHGGAPMDTSMCMSRGTGRAGAVSLTKDKSPSTTTSLTTSSTSSTSATATATAISATTSTTTMVRRRPSAESVRESIALQPRVAGVFVPSLPVELWALIFGYSCAAYFARPTSSSNDSERNTSETQTQNQNDNHNEPTPAPSASPPCIPQHIRRAQYTARLRHADAISRVCRLWNAVVQEAMYEVVWIGSARQGRLVAGRLGGDACLGGGGVGGVGKGVFGCGEMSAVVVGGGGDVERNEKKRKMGWFGRVRGRSRMLTKGNKIAPLSLLSSSSKTTSAPASALTRTNAHAHTYNRNPGIHIRALHIETPSMERCSPHDLLLILQHCPRLETFVDVRSVRRPMHPLALSLSPVAPFAAGTGPSRVHTPQAHADTELLTKDALLHTLLARPLKKLTWTNYEYDGGVKFYEDVLAPRLAAKGGVGKGLEELEVVVSGKGAFGMGSRNASEEIWGVDLGSAGDEEGDINRNSEGLSFSTHLESRVSALKLTELTARYTTSTTTTTTRSFVSHSPAAADADGPTLTLPALRMLTITLDNATFAVLSTWSMPLLTALCITSADFAYRGSGFRSFFEVHGTKIKQLELGHSSADLGQEEAWVTQRPSDDSDATTHSPQNEPPSIPLAAWCPNLSTFICSADAEWSWLSPDWIAPHVLLPTHPGLERIGVRGVERRVKGDWEDAERRAGGAYVYEVVDGVVRVGASTAGVENGGEDDPFFMLAEQFGSLLMHEAFPSLVCVRDMSWESDVIRQTGRLTVPSHSMAFSPLPSPTPISTSPRIHWLPSSPPKKHAIKGVHSERVHRVERAQKRQVDRFWGGVLKRCEERGIRLENWRGEEVTRDVILARGEDYGCR